MGELAPYFPSALDRGKKEGYSSLDFPKPRKGVVVHYIQLIGNKPDGSKHILITIKGKEDATSIDLKKLALRRYAERGRDPWMIAFAG